MKFTFLNLNLPFLRALKNEYIGEYLGFDILDKSADCFGLQLSCKVMPNLGWSVAL